MTENKREKEEKKKGKFIIEREYIEEDRIIEPEKLDLGGVDASGRWGLIVLPRVIEDFDHSLLEKAKRLPRGKHIENCWQCGNCTAVCPVAHKNPNFNPRYFIYIVRMGYKSEIKKLKKYIYLCQGCGLCSEACPKHVDPAGVMMSFNLLFDKI
jgi:heterodisulfide reductase subunit C